MRFQPVRGKPAGVRTADGVDTGPPTGKNVADETPPAETR